MLTLQPRPNAPPLRELDGFLPERFTGSSLSDVQRHLLWVGKGEFEAGEMLEITGDPADGRWRFAGGVSRVHNLGEGMTSGQLTLEGDAGDRLGAGMRGGHIEVRGDAGDEAGVAMRRGLIVINGRCGELAGYRMSAGTLLALGGCGRRPGLEMRRGTIGLFGEQQPMLPPTFRYACDCSPPLLGLLAKETDVGLPHLVSLFNGDLLTGGRGEVWTLSDDA